MIKSIIFDMDGLIIDSERLYIEAEKELAAQYGKTLRDETIWKMMGRNPLESMAVFVKDLGIDISNEEMLKKRDMIMEEKYRNDIVVMPGFFELIKKFSDDLSYAIVTGAQSKFLDIVVDQLGIREKFELFQSSDNISEGKPSPVIYQVALEKLRLNPEEAVVLEDSSNGSLAAKRAGCYTIAVPSIYTEKQDFSFVDYVASSLTDAKKHIEKLVLH